MDVEKIKRGVDLLSFVGRDTELKKVASSGGGEYAGPCPFCGGKDRFRLQPERGWFCRHCTGAPDNGGRWDDAIAYVMKREAVDFREACRRLGSIGELPSRPQKKPATSPPIEHSPPTAKWQEAARQLISECAELLWKPEGDKARAWLNKRGLSDKSLALWNIGYSSADRRTAGGLFVPGGIVIPCVVDDVVWYVKVRQAVGQPKYKQVAGGKGALFGAETLLEASRAAVITEGEFDCMLLYQEAAYKLPGIGVTTLGSATGQLDIDTWARYLLPVPLFLIGYDGDDAGQRAAAILASVSRRMHRADVPSMKAGDKDLTDYFMAGGRLRDWTEYNLARAEGGYI